MTRAPGLDGLVPAHQLCARNAIERPDAAAWLDGSSTLTWLELEERVARCAGGLASAGVGAGRVVSLMMADGPDFVVALLGAMRAGAIVQPLDPHASPAEIARLVERGRSDVLISDGAVHPLVRRTAPTSPPGRARVFLGVDAHDGALLDDLMLAAPIPAGGPDLGRAALYLYTSGSTGRAKRIDFTDADVIADAAHFAAAADIGPDDPIVCMAPLSHSYGLECGLMLALWTGATLIMPRADGRPLAMRAAEAWALGRAAGARVLIAVPIQYDALARCGPSEPLPLRYAFSSGSPLPRATYDRFLARHGVAVRSAYGSSEIGSVTCDLGPDVSPTSVGAPLEGVAVRIVDGAGEAVDPGRDGEIEVRSRVPVRPYADEAAVGRRDGWFRTGDRGRLGPSGRLFLDGRSPRFIDIGGFKVDPREVERQLVGEQGVAEVAVVAVEHPAGVALEAAVVGRVGSEVDTAALRTRCREVLPPYMVPARIVAVDALPRGAAGKVNAPAVADALAARAKRSRAVRSPVDRASVLRRLLDCAAAELGHRPPPGEPLAEAGLDSIGVVSLAARLGDAFDRVVPPTVLFDHPSPSALADWLMVETGDAAIAAPARADQAEPLAVVAVACRLPGGADSAEQLWHLLDTGRDAIGPFPTDRGWNLETLFDPDPQRAGRSYADRGGFIDAIGDFDPTLFRMSPREARATEPQQRLLLELTWECIERAGLDPTAMSGANIGTFIGLWPSRWDQRLPSAADATDGYPLLGTTGSVAAGRIAYSFGLRGPCLTVDTACSSSLVAVHLAARALRQGECDMALAGGATLFTEPDDFIWFSRLQALAPDGRCKAFSARADGAGWAEGGALVLLERLSDAHRRGHPVLAVVRGTAVNHDGRSQGMTAPSGAAQQEVIRRALADAELDPADIDAIEAHGTGTRLGDPIEVGALRSVFGDRRGREPLRIGTIKSNIGHAQAAAGVAGLVKVVLALGRERLPRTLHVDALHPSIDWRGVAPLTEAAPWPRGDRRRRAGVSSFGMSGTNAHVIVEEAPTRHQTGRRPSSGIPLVLSARDSAGLRAQAEKWAAWLSTHPGANLDRVRRAAGRRAHLATRAAIVGPALEGLGAVATGRDASGVVTGRVVRGDGIVFVYPGQGSQWVGMGRALHAACPAFASRVDACDAIMAPLVGWSVRDILCGIADAPALDRVEVVQPALFVMALGLTAAWRARGVRPTMVIGHSQGEIAAAVVAGALSLADGVRVVVRRSALLRRVVGRGGMALVPLAVDAVESMLHDAGLPVSVAVVNTADSTVVGGALDALDALDVRLAAIGLKSRRVAVDYASHGPAMDPILTELEAGLAGLRPQATAIPMISTVTGEPVDGATLTGTYWCRNLRSTVRFDRALRHLGAAFCVELSAHPILAMPLADAIDEPSRVVESLRRDDGGLDRLGRSLAALYVAGADIDWRWATGDGPLASLPTCAFQRQRLWVEPDAPTTTARPERPPGDEMPGPPREDVLAVVLAAVTDVTGLEPAAVDADAELVALGVDSLMFMQLKNRVRQHHGVDVPNALFFEVGTCARSLADFVVERLPAPTAVAPSPPNTGPASGPVTPGSVGAVAELMAEQMRAMADLARRQLETLQRLGGPTPGDARAPAAAPTPGSPPPAAADAGVFRPYRPIQRDGGATADSVSEMVETQNAATPTSKARTQADRFVFANNRNIAGFTPATKEMTYQIIADRAQGGHVWDLDGHRYVDLTQGFGSSLLGHSHPLLTEAIRAQLDRTWAVGPISNDAATVARQVCAMTGAERVAFYNSGTEAVMVSIRLARTATGRPKVVLFEGAYHGMFDGLMAIPRRGATPGAAAPMAPGVPDSMVADTLVLPYDDPESLRIIEERGAEIAGVLVESVQSRRPDRQPRAFLHRLRALTERIGAALIFDEVVTGFRTAPGGAQAWFGVKADLAAYGKVAGGAMPVGIVAGRAEFLDGVDGGMWRFGDDSMPQKTNTFVAGTFCSHPLTMASARAMLEHLAEQGPALQRDLNARTRRLCSRLNQIFAEAGVPLHTTAFGSLFRYVVPRGYALFYNRLLVEKVYIWEGRNCFLATAHTADDIEHIVAATRAAAEWLAEHVAPEAPPAPAGGVEHLPASAAQRIMYRRSQRPGSERAYHVPSALLVDGPLDVERFEPALTELTARHDTLRTSFHHDGEALWRRVQPFGDFDLNVAPESITEDAIDDFVDGMIRPFDLTSPVMLRVGVARLAHDRHLVVLDAHHLAVDGLSMTLLTDELFELVQNRVLDARPTPYRDYVAWHQHYLESDALKRDEAEWRSILADLPARVDLPRSVDGSVAARYSFRCERVWLDLSAPQQLRALARAQSATLNVVLHTLFQVWLGLVSRRDELFYGSPTAGRPDGRFDTTPGLFIGVVVYRARLSAGLRFAELVGQTRDATGRLMALQGVPFDRIQALMADAGDGSTPFEVGFNYETDMGPFTVGDLTATPHPTPMPGMSLGCVVEVHDHGDALRLCIAHDPERYRLDRVAAWARLFDALACRVVADPDVTIDAIRAELLADDGPLTEST